MKKCYPLYKEPNRNQFHFSPPIGWMNDINGAWYADGLYHFGYQHNPSGLSCKYCHVGHAYSPDLVHWYHAPNMLSPGINFEGPVWSGTAIVDTENRLGYGKGAVIAANTDFLRGQCVCVSTDGGWTFQRCADGPVLTIPEPWPNLNPPVESHNQRDPKIFWLDSEQCYVMVVYWDRDEESSDPGSCTGSMDFYSSKDMKSWSLFQRFRERDVIADLKRLGKDTQLAEKTRYLYECPNVFPMRLEGETYWVFHAGDSRYLIGKFEGLHYTVIEAPMELLSDGPDFYAGQTFENTDRTIGIYWMGHWNGTTVETYPFRNSATVPYELSLTRLPEGLRILRNPVRELEQLYADSREAACKNSDFAPADWAAPFFDLTVTVDLKETAAPYLTMWISDKQFRLDLVNHTFTAMYVNDKGEGRTVIDFGGEERLTMRVLADRDSIEIFFNGGRYCYTEEYGFREELLSFRLIGENGGLTANGVFHSLNSIWD